MIPVTHCANQASLSRPGGSLNGSGNPSAHMRLRYSVAFAEARLFMPGHDARRQFERFAIAGGMPRYLTALSGEGALADVICDRILDRNAGLWDEGRRVLEQKLREPKVYFAVLQCLASGDKESGEIASALRSDAQRISKYLNVLTDMRLIERRQPIESVATGRSGHWHLRDAFTRFWFRFVFPFETISRQGCRPVLSTTLKSRRSSVTTSPRNSRSSAGAAPEWSCCGEVAVDHAVQQGRLHRAPRSDRRET